MSGTKYKYLVETDPAKPARGERPACSPGWVVGWAPNGVELLPGLHTCWDIFS